MGVEYWCKTQFHWLSLIKLNKILKILKIKQSLIKPKGGGGGEAMFWKLHLSK